MEQMRNRSYGLAAVDMACVRPPARCRIFVGYERRDYGQRGELLGQRDPAGRYRGVHSFFEGLRSSLGFEVSHVGAAVLSALRGQLPASAASGSAQGSFIALATRGGIDGGDDGAEARPSAPIRKHSEV